MIRKQKEETRIKGNEERQIQDTVVGENNDNDKFQEQSGLNGMSSAVVVGGKWGIC